MTSTVSDPVNRRQSLSFLCQEYRNGRGGASPHPAKEFFKPVVAQVGGKTVRKSQVELVAQQMVRDAITKGPQARALLLKVIEAHEAREAAKEALQAKKLAEGTVDVDWTAEHEKLFQRIAAANEKFKQ